MSDETSFGHDIEGSWLLVEAADALGDAGLVAAARSLAVEIAETTCAEGRDTDGSIFYEAHAERPASRDKHAWVQAEAVVGLYNAYHISGRPHLLEAARMAWDVIETRFADRVNGDWFKVLHRSGEPLSEHPKIGPAATPYHQARACLEMMRRLGERP